jgi:hypothetical protein
MKKIIFICMLILSHFVQAGDCTVGNCENGYGTKVWKHRAVYDGYWKNGKKHGHGKENWSDGAQYIGNYKNGKFHGEGTFTWKDGRRYEGNWKNGKRHGQGTLYHADGTKQAGRWEQAKYIGTNPVITWIQPTSITTDVSSASATIKACIKSTKNVQLYVNEVPINNTTHRGFKVVPSSCDASLEKTINLNVGKNVVKIVVSDAAGRTKSSKRTIHYKLEKRIALVIGNSQYTKAPLRNPVNDAQAMANELRKLDFEVLFHKNLSQKEMKRAINDFGKKITASSGVSLFYYAGHGMQVKGENYLIPVDANIDKEPDVEFESVKLARVTSEMKYARNKMNIIILDACRDNPFSNTRSFSQKMPTSKGLARIAAPYGTFLAFATAPGSVAADGEGANGLYTAELIKAIRVPGRKIEDIFKHVRQKVYEKSNGLQLPWENSSIVGDFYFKK